MTTESDNLHYAIDPTKSFLEVPIWMVKDTGLSDRGFRLLCLMRVYAEGKTVVASEPEVSKWLKCSHVSTRKAVKELLDLGFIKAISNRGGSKPGGGRNRATYSL